jgi:TonB family protein
VKAAAPVRPPDFRRCVAASFGIHVAAALLVIGIPWPKSSPIEVDLTMTGPYLGTGPAKLGAPKQLVPKAKGIPRPAETPEPPAEKPQPPKDWTLPGPGTKTLEKPAPPPPTPGGAEGGTGTSPLVGGSGQGANFGTPNGIGDGGSPVTWPKLLNRDELMANIRKFYPERQRRLGREGDVELWVHIDVSGAVIATEVKASDDSEFEPAAEKVAALMKFAPAMGASGPVPVKIRAPIQFRLKDE